MRAASDASVSGGMDLVVGEPRARPGEARPSAAAPPTLVEQLPVVRRELVDRGDERRTGRAHRASASRSDAAERPAGDPPCRASTAHRPRSRARRRRRASGRAARARRAGSRPPPARAAGRPPPRTSTPSAARICDRRAAISAAGSRFRLNCRQRDSTVTGSFCGSVVASRNFTCGGGSSSVFRSALKECADSMCTSSIR